MDWLLWLRILQMVIELVAGGMAKSRAIDCAAMAFSLSAEAIRRRLD